MYHQFLIGMHMCILSACTIAVGLVEQLAQFHNHTVTDEVDQICGYLPESKYQHSCEVIVNLFGPVVIEL